MEKDKKFKPGDNIMVCGTLNTYITKIENDKIYFLNEDGIEKFETINAIEFLGSPNLEQQNKSFIIDCGIYPFEIYIFFSDLDYMFNELKDKTSKKSFKHIKKIFKEENNHDGTFLINDDNTMIIHMWNEIKNINELSVFNHELLHATIAIHRIIECELNHNSEETYTYLYGYLCEQVYKQLNLKFE